MACCIFVALIITNVLVFYRKCTAFLGFHSEPSDNLWQPPTQKPPLWRRTGNIVLPVLMVTAGSFYGLEHSDHLLQALNLKDCQSLDASQCHDHHH